MNDRTKKLATIIVSLLFFILCVVLVIVGQRHVGVQGLMVMLAGLAGLLFLLYRYNRKFK